jgi:hypothetical protein
MVKNLWILAFVMDIINIINAAIQHNPSAFLGWFCAALAVVIIMNEHNKQNVLSGIGFVVALPSKIGTSGATNKSIQASAYVA